MIQARRVAYVKSTKEPVFVLEVFEASSWGHRIFGSHAERCARSFPGFSGKIASVRYKSYGMFGAKYKLVTFTVEELCQDE